MNDNEMLLPISTSDDPPPPTTNPYQILLRQSRKMGRAATRTYDVTKEFLKRDPTSHASSALIPLPKSQVKKLDNSGKFNRIVKQSQEVLATAQTVILPTNWFSDKVIVDRTKVTITFTTFFWSSTVISIRIEDILSVSTCLGPLFGSLTVSTRVMNSTDHYEINYLWRKDAIRLKHIIQGYMIAVNNHIDTSSMSKAELARQLTQLGTDPTG